VLGTGGVEQLGARERRDREGTHRDPQIRAEAGPVAERYGDRRRDERIESQPERPPGERRR
jgi:hypothetical protein